ncbi:MAG: 2-C-methyl-D-erythritol 4-phosphate cytidylyltransferase [Micromonosporaceae bacterium]|nr:2-C-methyl-D-erythritol 4-phosphate cytidylyltransferase [Micromonosporaceae bacterium]
MYSLVLLNGGIGSRVAAGQPKQFIHVNGLPIIVYSLVAADAVDEIDEIVLNYPEGWREDTEKLVIDYAVKTPVTYVVAGASRHESVSLMLPRCKNERVIVHETARPLVGADDFRRIVADPHDNVSFMLPIPFTVAPVEPESAKVTGWLDRGKLRNVQLPQKFRKADLIAAHEYAEREGVEFTEDATLVAVAGSEVYFLDGEDRNFKVTTPTDVRLAGFLLGGEDDDE